MEKRRFIAAVQCPQCHTIDSIQMVTTDTDEWIECIQCQYKEQRPTAEQRKAQIEQQYAQEDGVGMVRFKPLR